MTETQLREALKDLRQNANRLCDRNQGGTYEDDCRASIARADAVLASSPETPKTCGTCKHDIPHYAECRKNWTRPIIGVYWRTTHGCSMHEPASSDRPCVCHSGSVCGPACERGEHHSGCASSDRP